MLSLNKGGWGKVLLRGVYGLGVHIYKAPDTKREWPPVES